MGGNKNDKKVSVIIPCYNKKEYIGAAIESALSLSYGNVEVIVIDDGSTDQSLSVIREYDDEVIWHRQKNRGAPVARNRGISIATGEYVKFLDADDLLVKGVLEKQVEQTRKCCGKDEIVFGDFATINGAGEIIDLITYDSVEYGNNVSLRNILKENIWTSSPLHKLKHLQKVNKFNSKITKKQEYYLHLKMAINGIKFKYKNCLTFYSRRRIEGRITSIDHLKHDPMYAYRDIKRVVNRIESPLPSPVRKSFGRDLWKKGRRLLRLGHEEEALTYFDEAKTISSKNPVVGSLAYRLAVSVFGPTIAEKFSEIKKYLGLSVW